MSHPTRDVWVEIRTTSRAVKRDRSHPTRDVWVEIVWDAEKCCWKKVTSHTGCVSRNSLFDGGDMEDYASHPTRDVWVEIFCNIFPKTIALSHPTRDVWVEMNNDVCHVYLLSVTSHTGCVSRNVSAHNLRCRKPVTSHTGCVSRNKYVTL